MDTEHFPPGFVSPAQAAGPGRLLVVDDEVELMQALVELLADSGYEVEGFASSRAALRALSERDFDVVLTDLMMPGLDGNALLRAGLEIDPHLIGVLMTGQGTVQTAVEAMRNGAFDYVLKPFRLEAILPVLDRAVALRRLRLENVQLHETVAIDELSRALTQTLDIHLILEKTADAALQQMGADEASVLLMRPDQGDMVVAAVRGANRSTLLGQSIPLEGTIAGWVARRSEPLLLFGPINDSRFAPLEPRTDVSSSISIPMLAAGQVRGVLNVSRVQTQRPFTSGQTKALSILANTAAAALENSRLFTSLQLSEARFRRLAENAPDLIYRYRLSPARGFEYVSPAATALTGYTPEEHYADPDLGFKLVHPDDRPELERITLQLKDVAEPVVLRWVRKDGTVNWTEQRNVLITDEAGQPVAIEGIARDVTERLRAEQSLAARARQQAVAAELGQRALAGLDLSALMEQAVGLVAQALEVEFAKVLERLPDDDSLLLRAGVGWTPGLVGKARVSTGIDSQAGYTLLADRPVVVEDLRTDTRFRGPPLLLDHDVVSGISVIIAGAERPFGVLGAHSRQKRAFTADDVNFLQSVANVLASAIGRNKAESALRLSDEILKRVHALVLVANANAQISYVGPSVRDILGYEPEDLLGEGWWVISRLDPATRAREKATIARAARGEIPTSAEPYERMVLHRDGTPRWIVWSDALGPPGLLVGVGHDITERKQRERELEAIAAVTAALRKAPTRGEMLGIILDQALELLKADGAALVRIDPLTGETLAELAHGQWAGATGLRGQPGLGVSAQVIASGQPYLNNAVEPEASLVTRSFLGHTRAAACVPLIAQDQTIGVLWVGRKSPMTSSDLRLLSAVADIAASAIQRASLHEQTEQRLQRLTALRAIDMTISASLDLRLTLSVLLEQVTNQLRVDAADVLLFNPHTQTLQVAAGRGFQARAIEYTHLRLGQGYGGRVALERRTISVPDLNKEEPDFTRISLMEDEHFRAYHGVPLIAKGMVEGVLEVFHRTPLTPDPEWHDFLEALAGQAAIAIDNAELFSQLQRANIQLTMAYDATIEGWSRALDLRDRETEGHTQRVTELTVRLAQALVIGEEDIMHLRRGALLHDIGKMGVPDSILLKPGPLSEEEWTIMRLHPVYAYEMLSPITYLRQALDIPYCHHEKWDGSGYPRALKGEQIPMAARLFAVVDVWDALRSDRPYRPAWPPEQVLEHIRGLSGTHFDPQAVDVFLKIVIGI